MNNKDKFIKKAKKMSDKHTMSELRENKDVENPLHDLQLLFIEEDTRDFTPIVNTPKKSKTITPKKLKTITPEK